MRYMMKRNYDRMETMIKTGRQLMGKFSGRDQIIIVTTLFIILTTGATLAITGCFSSAWAQPCRPSITWTPTKIAIALAPGETKTVRVSLALNRELSSLQTKLTPSLTPYVVVLPEIELSADLRTQAFRIKTSIPIDASPGEIEGTLHLIQNKKTIAKPLPIEITVVPFIPLTIPELGVTVEYPSNWVTRQVDGSTIISNAGRPIPEISEEALMTRSFFEIGRRTYPLGTGSSVPANQSLLPVNEWFDDYFKDGFPTELTSRANITVNGRLAIQIVAPEVGGLRAHTYISHGNEVTEVAYGLFAPQFVSVYEKMLNSITFSD